MHSNKLFKIPAVAYNPETLEQDPFNLQYNCGVFETTTGRSKKPTSKIKLYRINASA